MKYLGYIKLDLLQEKEEYRELFAPLSDSELADLKESIREGGIVDPLLVDRDGENFYVILAGHHRKMIAQQLGLEAVPCQLAETVPEIMAALFNNAARRQMTEEERQEANRKQNRVEDQLYQEKLIPQLWQRYKEGTVDREFVDNFAGKSPLAQQKMLSDLCIEREVTPKGVLAEIAELSKELEQQRVAYEGRLTELQAKLSVAEAGRSKAAEELKQKKEEHEGIEKRAEEALAKYNKTEEQITEKMRKEFKDKLANAEKEREKRAAAVKGKDKEIEALAAEIESWKEQNDGLQSASGLWLNEAARALEMYHGTIDRYSSPDLMESELEFCLGRVRSLIDWSKEHVWDPRALPILEEHDKAIRQTLKELIESVKDHQKPFVSLEQAGELIKKRVAEMLEKKYPKPAEPPRQEASPQELRP
jgi:ParB-like chromosome segregation protein Spo0J